MMYPSYFVTVAFFRYLYFTRRCIIYYFVTLFELATPYFVKIGFVTFFFQILDRGTYQVMPCKIID